jgi:hypothetical protein
MLAAVVLILFLSGLSGCDKKVDPEVWVETFGQLETFEAMEDGTCGLLWFMTRQEALPSIQRVSLSQAPSRNTILRSQMNRLPGSRLRYATDGMLS